MWLAAKRSASPEREKNRVPAMNPSCTALVNAPSWARSSPQARARSAAAALALNQSEPPSNSATTISTTANAPRARPVSLMGRQLTALRDFAANACVVLTRCVRPIWRIGFCQHVANR
jgi:hypothetical protein